MQTPDTLSKTYQQKTDKQHVIDNPDTYTGSMEITPIDTYVMKNEKIIPKEINIIPGLYKLFDEGIVNCRDHQVRMSLAMKKCKANTFPVTTIEVSINDGVITMYNDGNGIDVAKHPEYDLWIPEMIFGHLRTSTNYDKTEKKIVGGKNGFGFKLVLIWSEWGEIETVDHTRGLKYKQRFEDNLNIIQKPSITKCKVKPYTRVTFKPDYKRLGISGLSQDMVDLFQRRTYDIAAVTDKKIKVKYNDQLIPVKNFQQYVDLYIGTKEETNRIYELSNERWEYAICMAPKEEFTQVSFVNGIYTGKGGNHVNYILNQIVRKLSAFIKKRKKIDVKSSTIKEQIMLFVRCDINNPTFDSQTKDYMNTAVSKFGSTCDVSEKFIEKVAKMGVMDAACALTEVKDKEGAKKTDGSKSKNIRGIPKLIDANFAGGNESHKCTIILCEGDSAKAGIVSGLSKEDRNYIGVYPMKGKLFNIRGENPKRILENKEITEIKQILGLESGKIYTIETVNKKLRYGNVLFMTDQDLDGSHIKGLGINMFDAEWNSLINIPNFMGFMNTPILKAKKGSNIQVFYNDGEWNKWKETNNIKGWNVKYYKGLGTSTSKEFKEYFENKKIVYFTSTGEESRNAIDMVFNKKRSCDRKTWLEQYERTRFLDTNSNNVTYEEFIHKEMIHFSKHDCERSIPHIIDGSKTSQRKILFTAFKRRLVNEIKVAQFSGSVSEISCYHHGESSLNGAIVNMAQDYVGSNNINLLEPKGQFGTRLQGGEDSASERYIHTNLNPLTRYIYPEYDDKILTYLDDDGISVEPVYYAPIIPMILINGSKGIGTGFSTDIMSYNPLEIIQYLKSSLTKQDKPILSPYYEGFKGTITKINDTKYLIKGVYDIIGDDLVKITELPIGTWTDDYKQYIESLIEGDTKTKGKKKSNILKDYTDLSTDVTVDITLKFSYGTINDLLMKETEYGCNALEKLLKLYTTKNTTNMHMFDENEKLQKFNNIEDIIEHYISVRYDMYTKRKHYQINILNSEMIILSNKARFISEILNDTLELRKKRKDEVNKMLFDAKYDMIDEDADYKYLVRLPMDSVTQENVEKIMQDRNNKEQELVSLQKMSEKDIWLSELQNLEIQYMKYKKTRELKNSSVSKKKKKKTKLVVK